MDQNRRVDYLPDGTLFEHVFDPIDENQWPMTFKMSEHIGDDLLDASVIRYTQKDVLY